MRVDLFDFELPEELIALRPVEPRAAARLLRVRPQSAPMLADHTVGDLPELLSPGDMLVFNDTRVLPAALTGERLRGEARAAVSLNLHKQIDALTWRAFARPAKRIAPGDRLRFANAAGSVLEADVSETPGGGEIVLRFDAGSQDAAALIDAVGAMPLPPYIASRRRADARDRTDYQTVYARNDGSVAAPTAGLHFDDAMLERLRRAGVGVAFVTLHVGAGTFLPVKSEDTDDHVMHAEYGEIDAQTADAINTARAARGRVVAVGTTPLRLLESAADTDGVLHPFTGETDIFITPGYRFRIVDMLFTNFHLPRSTLFMLVSAFAGTEVMKAAYAHAIAERYRFYSYGDASLLDRSGT